MNILFVSRHDFDATRGGIERCTDVLTGEFIRCGFKVHHLVLIKTPDYVSRTDVETHYFPSPCCDSEENRHYLDTLIRSQHIDILINQYGMSSPESRLFLSSNACKRITELHGNPRDLLDAYVPYLQNTKYGRLKMPLLPLLKLHYKLNRIRQYRWVRMHSDAIVVLSKAYTSLFDELHDATAIANPIDSHTISTNSISANKGKSILYVGRMDRIQKTPQKLIRAWNKICRTYPDWTLDMVGDGPDRAYLEHVATNLGIPNIRFHGFQDPTPFYAKAPIYCITSVCEGFCMVLIEAMAHRCVPIAFDSFQTAREIIGYNHCNGLLIEPYRLDRYAAAIKLLIDNPALRESMAEAAYLKSQQFDVKIIAQQWVELFKSLLHKTSL
jgi:glycosyltransferase involved in cell wall biosynthesis